MAEHKNKKTTILITILSVVVICYTAAILYSAFNKETGPWEGRVLDIDTGEPIEGAVILAIWKTKTAAIIDYTHSIHGVTESVTDKEGYFYISQYYPINFLPGISETKGPYIQIYKPGYLFLDRINPMKFKKGAIDEDSSSSLLLSLELNLTYRVSANVIELPQLPNLPPKEKWKFLPHPPSDVPANKIINFMKALNEESKSLGLSPL